MNQLRGYVLKQSEDAVHWLEEYLKINDGEALHQLRVSLKKIRSVISFLEDQKLHKKKTKKQKKLLRDIFHSAAFIREYELHIQWLKKKHYFILLSEAAPESKLTVYKNLFLEEAGKNRKELSEMTKDISNMCSKIKQKSVFNYALGLKDSVTVLIQPLNRERWHELRKQVKQLLYAYNWQLEKEKIKLLTVKELAGFDQLQEAIGNWHDAEDLKTWLSDEQFFLSSNLKVKAQFNLCWEVLLNEIAEKEEAIRKLLKKCDETIR